MQNILIYIKKVLTAVIIDRKMVVSGKLASVEELKKYFLKLRRDEKCVLGFHPR